MRVGVTMFVTDQTIGIVELARAVEDRGFDSVWLPEHTHIPTSRRTPWPVGPPGTELPEYYARCLDPLVALTAAATATTRIRVGTGILLIAQRDPIVTAKALATLDQLSRGRLTVGVGFGWNQDELEDHGVTLRQRRALARERIFAMRRLWEDDVAAFDGEHVHVPPSWSWPKPAQRPLPVLLGGAATDTVFDHIVDYANGWIPIGGSGLKDAIPRLRDRLAAAGRDPGNLEIVPFSVVPDRGKLDYYEQIGVTEAVLQLPSAPADEILPILDSHAAVLSDR